VGTGRSAPHWWQTRRAEAVLDHAGVAVVQPIWWPQARQTVIGA
jgi:hypothetical protein